MRSSPLRCARMTQNERVRRGLAAGALVLLVWSVGQTGTPYGIPWAVTLGIGLVVAAAVWWWSRHDDEAPILVDARTALGVVLLFCLVGLALRLYTITGRPAWSDEMWTLRNSYSSEWSELLRVAMDDYWPPLHYLILNALFRIGDTTLIWMRAPSVFFGTLTIAGIYLLAKELFESRVIALFASALLTGMTTHIFYSQEGRVYALQVFLVVGSSLFFYRGFWQKRIHPGFLIFTVLLTYAHSFASWYFVSAQCAYVAVAAWIWKDWKLFRAGFLAQLSVLLAWMPLVAGFAWSRAQRGIVIPTYWATGSETTPGLYNIVEQYQGVAVRSWAGVAIAALLMLLAVAPLARTVSAQRKEDAPVAEDDRIAKVVVFLLCWMIMPVAFSTVVTELTTLNTFGEIRYHLTILPGMILMMAAGLTQIRSRAGVVSMLLAAVALPIAQLPRYYNELRPAVDEAAAIVLENGDEDELIHIGNEFRAFAYYLRGSYPTIGSAEWDELVQRSAEAGDERTMEGIKWGDTYAFEKIDTRVRYNGYYFLWRPDEQALDDRIREEVERGHYDGSYWMVLNDFGGPPYEARLAAMGVVCTNPVEYRVRGLTLRHCGS